MCWLSTPVSIYSRFATAGRTSGCRRVPSRWLRCRFLQWFQGVGRVTRWRKHCYNAVLPDSQPKKKKIHLALCRWKKLLTVLWCHLCSRPTTMPSKRRLSSSNRPNNYIHAAELIKLSHQSPNHFYRQIWLFDLFVCVKCWHEPNLSVSSMFRLVSLKWSSALLIGRGSSDYYYYY